jgi:hypothetical protein
MREIRATPFFFALDLEETTRSFSRAEKKRLGFAELSWNVRLIRVQNDE